MSQSVKPSKSRIPKQKRGFETRNKILNAAIELFSSKGYLNTNSNEIARKAGVSTGSFYMYFDDKKPLFLEIMELFYEEIHLEVLIPAFQDGLTERKEILDRILTALTELHLKSPELQKEFYSLVYSDKEVQEIYREKQLSVINRLSELLRSYCHLFTLPNPEESAKVIHGAVEAMMLKQILFPEVYSDSKIKEELNTMLDRYLS